MFERSFLVKSECAPGLTKEAVQASVLRLSASIVRRIKMEQKIEDDMETGSILWFMRVANHGGSDLGLRVWGLGGDRRV